MRERLETTLYELCKEVSYGYTASANIEPIGPKFLRITDIVPEQLKWDTVPYCKADNKIIEKYKLIEGDIVIARTGATTGYNKTIKKLDHVAIFASYLIRYRINEKIAFPFFIGHILKSSNWYDYVNAIAGGSAQPGANARQLGSFEISLPPLPEQKAIAGVLSSLDDKIDLLHRQNKTLESMAEALFRKWFIEPCKYSDTEEGLLKGFEFNSFSKWIETTIGGDWGKENYEDNFQIKALCIRGTDIADLNSGIPEKVPLRFLKETKFEKVVLKNGDIVLEISGGTEKQSTGRTVYISHEICDLFDYPFVFSNFCRMIRLKKCEYMFFVFLYMQYLYKQDEFFNLENGSSGIKNLNYKYLLFEQKFVMPNEELVYKFNEKIKILFLKIDTNKNQIISIKKQRDLLLPKLISGEVRVKIDS